MGSPTHVHDDGSLFRAYLNFFSFQLGPIMAEDLSLPEELWEKILSYLSPFEDWMSAERVCKMFREKIQKVHWRRVKRLEIEAMVSVRNDSVEFSFDVKGTGHKSVLAKEKFLQLMEVVAKRLVNLREIRSVILDGRLLGDFLLCLAQHSSTTSVSKLKILPAFGLWFRGDQLAFVQR